MGSRLIVFALLAGGAQCVSAQQPCTNEMAWTKGGSWAARSEDDLAMADSTYPKAQYPVALRKADETIALLKKAIPDPVPSKTAAPTTWRYLRTK